MRARRSVRPAGLLLACVLLLGCGREPAAEILSSPPETAEAALSPLWPLPDFALTERSGRTVSLPDLKGKVWVADFFYTTCPGPCPMLSSRLTALQNVFQADDRVRLVSISTDPAKDTPAVLKLYAEKFQATERWWFLTGPRADIFALSQQGFKLPLAEDRSAAEPITHSTRLALVDQRGVVRGFYDGVGEDGSRQLARDIRRLLDAPP